MKWFDSDDDRPPPHDDRPVSGANDLARRGLLDDDDDRPDWFDRLARFRLLGRPLLPRQE